jgi:hypothetical protein
VRFETSPDDLFVRLVNLALSKFVDPCEDDVSKLLGQTLPSRRKSGSPGGALNCDEAA